MTLSMYCMHARHAQWHIRTILHQVDAWISSESPTKHSWGQYKCSWGLMDDCAGNLCVSCERSCQDAHAETHRDTHVFLWQSTAYNEDIHFVVYMISVLVSIKSHFLVYIVQALTHSDKGQSQEPLHWNMVCLVTAVVWHVFEIAGIGQSTQRAEGSVSHIRALPLQFFSASSAQATMNLVSGAHPKTSCSFSSSKSSCIS